MMDLKVWTDWEYKPIANARELQLPEEDVGNAMAQARAECDGKYEWFGYRLWRNLVIQRPGYIVAAERFVDRLPRGAFGSVGPLPFTIMMLDWGSYKAPHEHASTVAFKDQALASGWKPAQANSYLVTLRPLRAATLGPWKALDANPMANAREPEGLNARQKLVYEHMSSSLAFPDPS